MSETRAFKKALRLEFFTIGYNMVEAAASIFAGYAAGSIALIGFGLDSVVESLSGMVLVWRLKKHGAVSENEEERIEQNASRFVGFTFLILGLYVLTQSMDKILNKEKPEASVFGIVIAVLSLTIMPILAKAKIKIGKELNLKSLIADARETLVCAWLSAALLLGLAANALFGFWLADPLTGLIIVGFLFKEGHELVFEKEED